MTPSLPHPEQAVATFHAGFSCAQAVFSTLSPSYGLSQQQALLVAGAFGGGMAHQGRTCGAVTGALMLIGLAYGQTQPGDYTTRDHTYALTQRFLSAFQSLHGTLDCRDLLGIAINTPEGLQTANNQGLFVTRCPRYVYSAVEILEKILAESAKGEINHE